MDINKIIKNLQLIIGDNAYRYKDTPNECVFFVSKKTFNIIKKEWKDNYVFGDGCFPIKELCYRGYRIFSQTALPDEYIVFGKLYSPI